MPDLLHDGHLRCPTNPTDYNGVGQVSAMVSVILPDKIVKKIPSLFTESATEAPNGNSDADVNVALIPVIHLLAP